VLGDELISVDDVFLEAMTFDNDIITLFDEREESGRTPQDEVDFVESNQLLESNYNVSGLVMAL